MMPMSPAMMAPPVKKQRAGNTPEDPLTARTEEALSYRSERLQELSQKYGTGLARPPHGAGPPIGVRTSFGPPSTAAYAATTTGGPPMIRATNIPQHSREPGSSMRGGGRPVPTGLAGPPLGGPPPPNRSGGPPVFGLQRGTAVAAAPAPAAPAPPNKPGMAIMQPRKSDIFPYVAKQSPVFTKQAIMTLSPMSPKPSAASVTAFAVKSPTRPSTATQDDAALARRLEVSFEANSPSVTSSRSKSAPPSRPPPPPGPPPLAKEEPSKSVSFQSPMHGSPVFSRNNAQKKPPAANTPYAVKQPENTTPEETTSTKHAGVTPFHPNTGPPGATPYRGSIDTSTESPTPTPPATGRRDLLRNMREFADTPPKSSSPSSSSYVKSPELILHEQLASTEKDKATALRHVAELQDEITNMRASEPAGLNKHVGFLSPMANILPSPGRTPSSQQRRRVLTPHPKRSLPRPTSPAHVDAERKWLLESTKRTPFEYDAEGTTFILRRPFGIATELDLWYKAGQLPTKLYANAADVEYPSTIEVAAVIEADNSIFVLFGAGDVRHLSATGVSTEYGNVEERASILGTVSYIDKEANEKEYSLDDFYEWALSIRAHYCTTVLSFATALQLDPPPEPVAPPPVSLSKEVETADKAVLTDTVKEEPKTEKKVEAKSAKKSAPPPLEEESSTDVLATFIQLFVSTLIGFVWFVCISLPIRILTSTFVMAGTAVLLSLIWLYVADDNGAGELGAAMRIYSNRPGIM